MNRGLRALILCVLCAFPPLAQALPTPSIPDKQGWTWRPVSVYRGVDLETLSSASPFVPERTPRDSGSVIAAPGLAVLFWIPALGSVRVRKSNPSDGANVRFHRIETKAAGSHAIIDAPGREYGNGEWLLTQPPGTGGAWAVDADRPTLLIIERAEPRKARMIWEHVVRSLMEWIHKSTELPWFPPVHGSAAVVTRLTAHEQAAYELLALDPPNPDVRAALASWRIADALMYTGTLRPLVRPYYGARSHRPRGSKAVVLPLYEGPLRFLGQRKHPFLDAASWREWQIKARGPGVLRIDVRALFPEGAPPQRRVSVQVHANGHELARDMAYVRPALIRDPSTAHLPIPTLVPLETEDGIAVSTNLRLSIPLLPGRHTYRIKLDGVDMARARIAQRVGRSDEVARGYLSQIRIERAQSKVQSDDASLSARVARALVDDLAGRGGSVSDEDLQALRDRGAPLVAALLRFVRARGAKLSPDALIKQAQTVLKDIEPASQDPPSPLEREVRRRLFDVFRTHDEVELAVRTLRPIVGDLDSDAFTAFVMAIPSGFPLAPLDGALQRVSEGAPLDVDARRAHLRLWKWTRWESLPPTGTAPRWTWIEKLSPKLPAEENANGSPDAEASRAAWTLGGSSGTRIHVPDSPDPSRPLTVFRVYGFRGTTSRHWSVQVDGRSWSAPSTEFPDAFEIALPAGPHEIRVRGGPRSQAFGFLPPPRDQPRDPRDSALWSTMWEVPRGGEQTEFELEEAPFGMLLKLDLRAASDDPADLQPVADPSDPKAPDPKLVPIALVIGVDEKIRRRVVLYPTPPDSAVMPVTGPRHATTRISVRIPIPPGANKLFVQRISGGKARVFGSLAARRWMDVSHRGGGMRAPLPVKPPTLSTDPEATLQEVARLSRKLVANPDDTRALTRRGHALLALERPEYARQDLLRLEAIANKTPSSRLLAQIAALATRLGVAADRRYVAIPSATGPEIIHPPLAAAGLSPNELDIARHHLARARAPAKPDPAPPEPPAEPSPRPPPPPADAPPNLREALLATDAQRQGNLREAAARWARIYDRTGDWRFGLAALRAFRASTDLPVKSRASPALAFGVATRVADQIRSPEIRGARQTAAANSRWDTSVRPQNSGGPQRVSEGRANESQSDLSRLLIALAGAPWAAQEANLVRAGRRAVVKTAAAGSGHVAAELWCANILPDRNPNAHDHAHVQLGLGGTVEAVDLPLHEVVERSAPATEGPLRLSGSLSVEDRSMVCLVRFKRDDVLLTPPRSAQWAKGAPSSPIQWVVGGPTVVRARVRRRSAGVPSRAIITAVSLDRQHVNSETMDLALARGSNPGPTTEAGLFLARDGPYVVTLRPARSEVLGRLAVRTDRWEEDRPAASEQQGARRRRLAKADETAASLPWPAPPSSTSPRGVGSQRAVRANVVGAPYAEFRYGRDDVADADDLRPHNFARATLGFRREILRERLWLRSRVHTQLRQSSGVAGAIDGTMFGQFHPRRLRGSLHARLWIERFEGTEALSTEVRSRVMRPVQLTSRTAFVPSAGLAYRYQSLSPSRVAASNENAHRQVYTLYTAGHPLVAEVAADVRWRPLQDLAAVGGLNLTMNSDLASVDHFDIRGVMRGIASTRKSALFMYRATYEPSIRFADADRPETFVRHRIGAGGGLVLRFIGAGRLTFSVRDSVFVSRPHPLRNSFLVLITFEAAGGRGVRDLSPMELDLRNQHQNEWWREAAEDLL